jgi:hypothetical protein
VTGKLHWYGCVITAIHHESMNVNHWDQLFLSVLELICEWSLWAELQNDSSSNNSSLTWCHSNQLISFDNFVDVIVGDNWCLLSILIDWVEHKAIITVSSLPFLESDSEFPMQFVVAHILLTELLPEIGVIKDKYIKNDVRNPFDGSVFPT